ncbi:DNA-directed RNA polymerase subunit D [Candidatus Pacearchaeota archaeon]|jgi:DNA-directed RNA polymerase subunit D|nr:DNA-directed RNA polymerase subunit D [Candidatus Pacearchaeota archaeon]|tara:strand:+ start:3765 stop:4481 length:717 start_codon:yes stop_codon:yes gene_type:complete
MKIIEKKPNQIVFSAKIEDSLANSIRRYLNNIPIIAVDELEIIKNDSPLYDETIAHRVGLIPLKMEKAEKAPIKLKLSANKEGFVNSGELKGKIKSVYENIPITFLNKNQELEIVATTKIGKGNEHSKFSPGLMFYRNIVELKIDSNCPKEVIDACPQNILKSENGKIIVVDNIKCDICEACIEVCSKKKKDSIKIIPTDELVITLESFGQLDVNEIFKRSIDELRKDLKDISKKISK